VAVPISESVSNLSFVQPDGGTVALSAFAGRPLLLIFLRHLA
jgi:hypothetical protein